MSTPNTNPSSGSGRSTSEKGFGARLGKAKSFIATAKAFTPAYDPSEEELKIDALETAFGLADDAHSAAIAAKAQEKQAEAPRKKLFDGAGGLKKKLSGINGAVEAAFTKDSPQYTEVSGWVAQIQGNTSASGNSGPDGGPSGGGQSQSQRSYASMYQAFANIVAAVTSYGAAYNPKNDALKAAALETFRQQVSDANDLADAKSTDAREAENTRDGQLATLGSLIQRAKAAVKSQYGYGSPQEKAVRKFGM